MALLDTAGRVLGAAKDAAAGLLLSPAELQRRTAALWRGFDTTPPHDPAEFQRELDARWPRDGVHSWLLLDWHPGYPWEPCHRWVLFQMTERDRIPDPVIHLLEGPDPRTLGWWDPRRNEYRTRARITRRQWELYRERSCFAQTYWIIQGAHGGHRAKFTPMESFLSVERGGAPQPPDPGALPYAPPDGRVIAKLEQFQRMKDYIGRLEEQEIDEAERTRRMRAAVWEWLDTQTMEVLDEGGPLIERHFKDADLPRSTQSLAEMQETAREQFIQEE